MNGLTARPLLQSERELNIRTIGHSTRTLEEFFKLLALNEIKVPADVRRFPASLNTRIRAVAMRRRRAIAFALLLVRLTALKRFCFFGTNLSALVLPPVDDFFLKPLSGKIIRHRFYHLPVIDLILTFIFASKLKNSFIDYRQLLITDDAINMPTQIFIFVSFLKTEPWKFPQFSISTVNFSAVLLFTSLHPIFRIFNKCN